MSDRRSSSGTNTRRCVLAIRRPVQQNRSVSEIKGATIIIRAPLTGTTTVRVRVVFFIYTKPRVYCSFRKRLRKSHGIKGGFSFFEKHSTKIDVGPESVREEKAAVLKISPHTRRAQARFVVDAFARSDALVEVVTKSFRSRGGLSIVKVFPPWSTR